MSGLYRTIRLIPLTTRLSNIGKRNISITFNGLRQNHDEFTQDAKNRAKIASEKRQRADEDEILKEKILLASLKHISQFGWSREAVKCGAKDLGYPDVASGLAASDDIDVVHFHLEQCKANLVEIMKQQKPDNEFLYKSIESRLRMNIPYINRWSEAMALMALPQNVPSSLHLDLELVDDICHYSGHKSSNTDWYIKRLSLLAIYKSTELTMIQDKSNDYADTWLFLKRRLNDEFNFSNLVSSAGDAGNLLHGVASTVQNIIGMSRK